MSKKQAKARMAAINHQLFHHMHLMRQPEIEKLIREINHCKEVMKNAH